LDLNEKQEKILSSAIILFSTVGFFNTSMKDIAENAGIAVGTIYIYYKSKEELLDGIYKYSSSIVLKKIKLKLKNISDPLEMLRIIVKESIELSLKNPDVFMILFVDHKKIAIKNESNSPFNHFNEYIKLGKSILIKGKENGIFEFPDHENFFSGIMGFWSSIVLRAILIPVKVNNKKIKEEIVNLFENTIIKGIRCNK